MQGTHSTNKSRRGLEEDFAEGVCCVAGLNFVIFAVGDNVAEGACCIVGRNFVIFIVDYNKMKLQRRGCADCVFLVLFSSRIALYECIIESIYMIRCRYHFSSR